jgi:hypothetical protein
VGRRIGLKALLSLVGAASGCVSGDERAAMPTVSIDTIGGVVHVSNDGVPERWVAHPSFALGSADGDVQFGRIMSLAADADGLVYVADGIESRVLLFDSLGNLVTMFGRQGAGPGEFRDLYSVALLGDTVVTLDPRGARLGLFDKRGRWLGLWRHQALTGDVRLEAVSDDEIYNPIVIPRDRSIDRAYVRFTHTGPSDTIVLPARDERAAQSGVTCMGSDGGIHFRGNPFAGREIIRAAPRGHLLSMWTADYRLAVLNATLDTVRVIERVRPPTSLPDGVWETYQDEFREWFDGIPSPQCQGRSEPERPTSYPAAREVVLDPTGRVWVETYTNEGFAFDVFDLEGRLLATLSAPERDERVRPFVRGERLYVVAADSLGVQRVEAFRVTQAGR